jgi:DNA-directed RNA polymerase specialized sigma subunit
LAEKCTSSITGLPRGGASDKETTWIRLAEIEEEINADVDKYVDMRKEIEAAINTVDDITLRTLLRYRYLNGLTWEKIAVEMNYTWRHTHRIHSAALQAIKMA